MTVFLCNEMHERTNTTSVQRWKNLNHGVDALLPRGHVAGIGQQRACHLSYSKKHQAVSAACALAPQGESSFRGDAQSSADY